jgi:hypothetical protein
VTSQTWLPSHVAPTVLTTMRRSVVGLCRRTAAGWPCTHIEAVGEREADQQDTDQDPPDQFEGCVIHDDVSLLYSSGFLFTRSGFSVLRRGGESRRSLVVTRSRGLADGGFTGGCCSW